MQPENDDERDLQSRDVLRSDRDLRQDADIAADAFAAIRSRLRLSSEHINVAVTDGRVALVGIVEWKFQRQTAEDAVRSLKGVMGVNNSIQLRSRVTPADIRKKIDDEFRRSAENQNSRSRRHGMAGAPRDALWQWAVIGS